MLIAAAAGAAVLALFVFPSFRKYVSDKVDLGLVKLGWKTPPNIDHIISDLEDKITKLYDHATDKDVEALNHTEAAIAATTAATDAKAASERAKTIAGNLRNLLAK